MSLMLWVVTELFTVFFILFAVYLFTVSFSVFCGRYMANKVVYIRIPKGSVFRHHIEGQKGPWRIVFLYCSKIYTSHRHRTCSIYQKVKVSFMWRYRQVRVHLSLYLKKLKKNLYTSFEVPLFIDSKYMNVIGPQNYKTIHVTLTTPRQKADCTRNLCYITLCKWSIVTDETV